MTEFVRELPMLGYIMNTDGSRQPVYYPGDKHLITVVPNRGGKKTGLIGPNMVRNVKSSLVATDPKGELATEFAAWRSQFQRCVVFDPFHIVPDWALPPVKQSSIMGSDGKYRMFAPPLRARFNFVDMVARSAHPVADSKLVASAIITSSEREAHWGDGAKAFYSAMLTYAALDPRWPAKFARTPEGIWQALNLPKSELLAFLILMTFSKVARGFVRREAIRYLDGNPTEMTSIKNSIFTNCSAIFDDPEILDNLSETTIDFEDIQREPVSIFLCLPGARSVTHSRWFKLILTCIFAAIENVGLPDQDEQQYQPRTVFYLDEFGTTLGRMDSIRDALPRMPGYGVQFWPFVQDLNQLKALYGDGWEVFISNCGVLTTHGGSLDLFTTEYFSKLTGQETRQTTSLSRSTQPTAGIGTSTAETGRPLYFPGEIAGINNPRPDDAPNQARLRELVIFDGQRVAELQRYEYFRDELAYTKFFRALKPPRRSFSGKV